MQQRPRRSIILRPSIDSRKVHNTEIVETPQDYLPEPPAPEIDPLTSLKVT